MTSYLMRGEFHFQVHHTTHAFADLTDSNIHLSKEDIAVLGGQWDHGVPISGREINAISVSSTGKPWKVS
jgi:hypothetical protein